MRFLYGNFKLGLLYWNKLENQKGTTMTRLIRKYPEQAFLFLFNTGIFTYLQVLNRQLAEITGFSGIDLSAYLPEWLSHFIGSSLEQVSSFMSQSTWSWLIISFILALLIRFVKGIIKFILFLLIVGGGLYLVWQNQEILHSLVIKS